MNMMSLLVVPKAPLQDTVPPGLLYRLIVGMEWLNLRVEAVWTPLLLSQHPVLRLLLLTAFTQVSMITHGRILCNITFLTSGRTKKLFFAQQYRVLSRLVFSQFELAYLSNVDLLNKLLNQLLQRLVLLTIFGSKNPVR